MSAFLSHKGVYVPRSEIAVAILVVALSVGDSVLTGYDGSMMGSLNTMDQYLNDAQLDMSKAESSLNTASSYIGGTMACFYTAWLSEWHGRRMAVLISAIVSIVGAIVQGLANNVASFVIGRIIIGNGVGIAAQSAVVLVSELADVKYRAFALGLYYTCWQVGTFIASGICYGTSSIPSDWAWRIPTLIQIVPPIVVVVILAFLPESPRWLFFNGHEQTARDVLLMLRNHDVERATREYDEIRDQLLLEKAQLKHKSPFITVFQTKANWHRVEICVMFSILVMLCGTNIITYYFSLMLDAAHVTSTKQQLAVNLAMCAVNLICGVLGSACSNKIGRKLHILIGILGCALTFFIFGGLIKKYRYHSTKSQSYGTISVMFIFNIFSYPPEVLKYNVRTHIMAIYTLTTKLSGLLVTFVAPYALSALPWQFYIMNAAFDLFLAFHVWWRYVETRNLTLEQASKLFGDNDEDVDLIDASSVTLERYGPNKISEL